jgi:hypothetical protein
VSVDHFSSGGTGSVVGVGRGDFEKGNSQTKTSKVRDDKLGGGDHFSEAEKNEGRIVDIIGLDEREHCALVGVLGSA